MPIEIIKDTTSDPLIDSNMLIATIEKNRDRVRTTAGMIMSLSGISLSVSLTIVLFTFKESIAWIIPVILICIAAVLFLIASLFAIEASFFRKRYQITTRSQFIVDLQELFARETRYVRIASISTICGLASLVAAIVFQAVSLL